ncbi:MAG TPA: CHC2 zinc finger domain-containing protein [Bryobacteraceae bacterium]|nr:CHC2 zinc finger domain-containing protein [Bryobacteraceae bacterium]
MARIPDEVIERLKLEVPLERLAEARGVKLKQHGADLVGLCPFHEDREPSLVISPKKNLWHCLGACQSGGSVIDWVMRAQGVSFRHAVELLRSQHPSLMDGAPQPIKHSTVRKLAPPIDREAGDAEALRQVVHYYHETLKQSPEALGYLEKRGLKSQEMIERFQLGFANRTLGLRLPQANRKPGAELRGRLQRLGILRDTGHEHFNGSLVIPILDRAGQVLGLYGRKITEDLRPGTPLHLYLAGPHRGVWNEEALEASEEIILCESLIDALTFWCAGFRNVTSSYGVSGFTDDHRAALKKYDTRKVVIAYDRDAAGDTGAAALATELIASGIECTRVLFPHNMDANEYALKVTPADKSLAVLLNSAEWLGGKALTARQVVEPEPSTSTQGDEIVLTFEDRRYRIRGLGKNLSYDLLRVNVLASRAENFHVDTLDLYSARQRAAFVKQAALEMQINEDAVKRDLGRVLLKLEELQDKQIRQALEPKQRQHDMSNEDRQAALDLLQDPDLLNRILSDFARCGVIGEETNKLVGYLAAVSRRLDAPLAVLVQSSSAAGKSSLMDAVLAFVPEEDRIEYSAMTGQSLFYMGEGDLKHKVLAIAEEEGAARAAYALKLLQSEGVLTIASTGKDPATGRLLTHQYRVEGPVMIFLTTTAIDLDEELLNRCLVLTVNEDREQTQAIHKLQREQQTLEGLLAKQEREAILKIHRNAQRLLKPLFVANPYARDLTFPDHRTRTRRDHMKYLTLIRAIALLHQHQRTVKTARGVSYIEATPEDIQTADRLMKSLLERSLDELPPQTRKLLDLITQMVNGRKDYRFSRRDVREHTQWGHTQLKIHLHRLEELEYLIVHQGGRGQSFVYELHDYDPKKSALEENLSGPSRPQVGGMPGGCRVTPTPITTGSGVLYAAAKA